MHIYLNKFQITINFILIVYAKLNGVITMPFYFENGYFILRVDKKMKAKTHKLGNISLQKGLILESSFFLFHKNSSDISDQ